MRAGKLRHKAQFQRATDTRDAFGGVALTWETYGHGWIRSDRRECAGNV